MNIQGDESLQRVSNINHAAHGVIWKNWGWWVGGLILSGVWAIVSFVVLKFDFIFSIALPLLILGYCYDRVFRKVRKNFWVQFALAHVWFYSDFGIPGKETGIMFQQGTPGTQSITHVVTGSLKNGQPLRIFEYEFGIRRGKHTTRYYYTVFGFTYQGTFPHAYLNRLDNTYGISVGETIPVPTEFSKVFRLSAPRKYEIEVLQIFTPDTLQYLLDIGLPYDVELVGQELLLFTEGKIYDREELEKRFELAKALNDRFDDILHKMRFAKVGTYSSSLV